MISLPSLWAAESYFCSSFWRERVWLGSTMFSCLWLSSTDTFSLAFICLLALWKRLRMAILMVPSSMAFLGIVFWMSAQGVS